MSALPVHQPSMWDLADEPVLTPLRGRVVRHRLAAGAWVDHLPGWVEGSDDVLEVLLGDIGWRADRRQMYDREVAVPRLLRWYDEGEELPHPLLTDARRRLGAHYAGELGEPFATTGCASTATGATPSPGTATGSAGAAARTRSSRSSRSAPRGRWRCGRSVGRLAALHPRHGDLVVMGAAASAPGTTASQDQPRRRPAGERPVPPPRHRLKGPSALLSGRAG